MTLVSKTRTRPFTAVTLALLLLVGLYFPLSIAGQPSERLYIFCWMISLGLISWLGLGTDDAPTLPTCFGALVIVPLMLVFTSTSGIYNYNFVPMVDYIGISLLFLLSFRSVQFPKQLSTLYTVINFINVIICLGLLLASGPIDDAITNYYGYVDPELVPSLLLLRKPILTFGTHSIAGFFFYVFFYISLQAHEVSRKRIHFVFALCYWVLLIALTSVTGLAFAVLALIQIVHHLWSRVRHRWIWLGFTTALSIVVIGFQLLNPLIRATDDIVDAGQSILSSPTNGFLGRYSPTGTMYQDIVYLEQHPFRPVGFSEKSNFMFGDSGFLGGLLRGSVLLLILIYGELFLFLKRNLIARKDFYIIFGATLAFESGYSVLPYVRTLALLPFFLIYLNHLRREQALNDA